MSCCKSVFRLLAASGLLSIAVCMMSGCAAAAEKGGTHGANQAVFVFQRSGGIAGFHDDLTIYADSTFAIKGLPNQPTRKGKLNAAQQTALDKLLAKFGDVAWLQSDPPNVADGMSLVITIRGQGSKTSLAAADAEFREIQALAASVLRPKSVE